MSNTRLDSLEPNSHNESVTLGKKRDKFYKGKYNIPKNAKVFRGGGLPRDVHTRKMEVPERPQN